jgi:hypothetical protein
LNLIPTSGYEPLEKLNCETKKGIKTKCKNLDDKYSKEDVEKMLFNDEKDFTLEIRDFFTVYMLESFVNSHYVSICSERSKIH